MLVIPYSQYQCLAEALICDRVRIASSGPLCEGHRLPLNLVVIFTCINVYMYMPMDSIS